MIGRQFSAAAQAVDSASVLQVHGPADTVVVESPLPGGISEVVRFLLNTVPPWIQIGGVVVGALVAALVLRLLFVRRGRIYAWVVSRDRGIKIALAAAALLVIVVAGGMGAATWNYTQHSNDFCVGCHVMNPAFKKFASAENKHGKLSCHDCHQQSLYASARQLYLWVAERPEKIGSHAKVPNQVCETCHVTGDTATWQRIASTAGHRVHLESDSSALEDIQCVSCHGVEVHRFLPVSQTCGESGCHKPSETRIVLGKMAEQTTLHCTSCHEFTADVPALATFDSARGTLVPGKPECLGCHEMEKVLGDFDAAKDPHAGKCGTCHNPHVQKTAAAAVKSCTTAGCHFNWRDEPFHVGASHRSVAEKCLTCHAPHQAKVDASNCESCHLSVRSKGRLRPPLPFDTARALRRVTTGPGPWWKEATFERDAMLPRLNELGVHLSLPPPPTPADSFPHARHARLACLECHETGTAKGRLTFEAPRGCAICHHQAPRQARCASCHQAREYAAAQHATMTVTVPGRQPAPRPVDFLHSVHSKSTCLGCHTTPVSLATPPGKALCNDCHSEHHAVGGNCSSCHKIADPKIGHDTPETAHQRCDGCHTATTIARLTPTRSFCSTCHTAKAKGHYDQKECSVCHFLAEPGVHRAQLTTPPAK